MNKKLKQVGISDHALFSTKNHEAGILCTMQVHSSGQEPIYIKLGEKCVKCQQNSLKQVNQGFNTNFDKK